MNRVIVWEHQGRRSMLARLRFCGDGSIAVSAPVHPSGRVVLKKRTLNISERREEPPTKRELDGLGTDRRGDVELIQHPDGLLELCGPGLSCGRDPHGLPHEFGIAYHSIAGPVRGPACTVTVRGIERLVSSGWREDEGVIVSADHVADFPQANALVVEMHYFPWSWSRGVVQTAEGKPVVRLVHPAQGIACLRVLWPPDAAAHPLFAAFTVYHTRTNNGQSELPAVRVESLVGRKRLTLRGNEIRESLACSWPEDAPAAPNASELFLNEVAYDPSILEAPVIPAWKRRAERLDGDDTLWPPSF